MSAPWRTRIVGRGDVPPAELVANPRAPTRSATPSAAGLHVLHAVAESWRPVEDLPYEVSELGRVRRVGAGRGVRSGHVLAPRLINSGYLAVTLHAGNRRHERLVHRLVAAAFAGAPPPDAEVNHRNGNKRDNSAANLEWVTRSENIRHGIALGTIPIVGSENPCAKLTEEQVSEIRRRYRRGGGPGYKELGHAFDVTWGTIRNIVRGRTWRAALEHGVVEESDRRARHGRSVVPARPPVELEIAS